MQKRKNYEPAFSYEVKEDGDQTTVEGVLISTHRELGILKAKTTIANYVTVTHGRIKKIKLA